MKPVYLSQEEKETFYDTIAADFDRIMNMYDTQRRIQVIFDDFLGQEDMTGKLLLDGGCGTGWFTQKALSRGAKVISLDISPKLVAITQHKNSFSPGVCASILSLPFDDNTFDYVISSDVIEHTRDPFLASEELIRVLKPGGKLAITVPNRSFWYFSVLLSNSLGLRKYRGCENWVPYFKFRRFLKGKGLMVINYKGIHLFPFVIKWLNRLLYFLDKIFQYPLGWMMVNLAAYAQKKKNH